MNLIEVDRALRQLRLGGMAGAVEARVREAQAEKLPHLDLVARLISDELTIWAFPPMSSSRRSWSPRRPTWQRRTSSREGS